MNGRWFFVDGVLTQLTGSHDDIVDETRELRANGSTVKAARPPKPISSREIARASSHGRRR